MNVGKAEFDLGADGAATLLGRVSASLRLYGLAGPSGRDCSYKPSPPSHLYAEPFGKYFLLLESHRNINRIVESTSGLPRPVTCTQLVACRSASNPSLSSRRPGRERRHNLMTAGSPRLDQRDHRRLMCEIKEDDTVVLLCGVTLRTRGRFHSLKLKIGCEVQVLEAAQTCGLTSCV
jgi:hypothetical protein